MKNHTEPKLNLKITAGTELEYIGKKATTSIKIDDAGRIKMETVPRWRTEPQ